MQNQRLGLKVPISGRQDELWEGHGAQSTALAVLFWNWLQLEMLSNQEIALNFDPKGQQQNLAHPSDGYR